MDRILPRIQPRSQLLELLQKHCQQALQHKRDLALMLVNLKRFAHINAAHGYATGDDLINMVFARLFDIAKSEQCLLRTGSNEFALILPLLPNSFVSHLAAQKTLDSLAEPFNLKNQQILLHPAIGIALLDPKTPDTTELCIQAEDALHKSQEQGDDYVLHYPEEPEQQTVRGLEEKLDHALAHDEFELFFQPKLCLRNQQLYGAESLIRWKTKDNQYISPELFIPFAEKTGQIIPLTKWIIQSGLRKQCELQEQWPELSIAINISAACFREKSLADDIRNALNIWGANPNCITLEITESAFMEDLQTTISICRELRDEIGVKTSIDDFGTGFSSLEYFKSIPADELKIDQAFIKNMANDPINRHIANMVIQLAHGVGIQVVAEGIEDQETLKLLAKMKCDIAQGYFIARPMSSEHFCTWLDQYSYTNALSNN